MAIYNIKSGHVRKLPVSSEMFRNEADLESFFSENLEELLGIKFLVNQFPAPGKRMDTLAIDENQSPVVLEYKWGQDDAIVTQGMFYYGWLVSNKQTFNLLVENKLGKDVSVNWTSPRVILVAQNFDVRTIEAVKQLGYMELLKYTPYGVDTLLLENIGGRDRKTTSVKNTKKSEHANNYDLEYHFTHGKSSENVRTIFLAFRDKLLSLPDVREIMDQKTGITYRTTMSFVRFEFRATKLNVMVKEPRYIDPHKMVRDITSHEWGYKGQLVISQVKEIEDAFSIIKQSYQQTL